MDEYLTQHFWKNLFEFNGFILKSHYKNDYSMVWYTQKDVYIGYRYNTLINLDSIKNLDKYKNIIEHNCRNNLYFIIIFKDKKIKVNYNNIKDFITLIEGIKDKTKLLLCLNMKWANSLLDDFFNL